MAGRSPRWRAVVARVLTAVLGVALAAGLALGSPAPAHADVLDDLGQEYVSGAGGGQLSNLVKVSLRLRAMGFRPSKANLEEIAQAMEYRPNQMPLISALKGTIAYQQKIKAQMEILQQAQSRQANSAVMGAGQMPAAGNPAQIAGAPVPGSGAVDPAAAAPMMPAPPPATP